MKCSSSEPIPVLSKTTADESKSHFDILESAVALDLLWSGYTANPEPRIIFFMTPCLRKFLEMLLYSFIINPN